MKLAILLALLSFVLAHRPSEDLVNPMPFAYPIPGFNIYSGYFKLWDGDDAKQIHYVFVEQAEKKTSAPVVLWLNGGPGCSSMDGFLYENGPFYFEEQSWALTKNPYSWNREAHMLYFESPAGVGFSVLGSDANRNFDDDLTSKDNLVALISFFSNFTQYANNDFYISGESYAGIYVPWTAAAVMDYNLDSNTKQPINLKGIIVGNGVVDYSVDVENAYADFTYSHGLISPKLYNRWKENDCTSISEDPICVDTLEQIGKVYDNINIYDIYRECITDNYATHRRYLHANLKEIPPCIDALGVIKYFSSKYVRDAFHISPLANSTWDFCNEYINYTTNYEVGSYSKVERIKDDPNLRILIYSGDTDGSVPTIGTRAWINKMKMTTEYNWKQWQVPEKKDQVAGYVTKYKEGLTFVTIRGTGHMSIQWKRPEGFDMFRRFLNNEEF